MTQWIQTLVRVSPVGAGGCFGDDMAFISSVPPVETAFSTVIQDQAPS